MAIVHTLLHGNSLDSNEGGIAFCAVLLVESVDATGRAYRIVVDPGAAGRRTALRAALVAVGLHGKDIDAVVLTHAHWDHFENLDEFPQAAIWAHSDELAYVCAPHRDDFATPRWTNAVLDAYDVQAVDDGTELATDVTILGSPGHSAGTIAVSVTTPDGVAVIAGDAIQNVTAAQRRQNPLVFWDDAQASNSIERIVEVADVIYPGHDRAFRLSSSGAVEYTEQYTLRLTGPARDLALTTTRADEAPTRGIFEPRPRKSLAMKSPTNRGLQPKNRDGSPR